MFSLFAAVPWQYFFATINKEYNTGPKHIRLEHQSTMLRNQNHPKLKLRRSKWK